MSETPNVVPAELTQLARKLPLSPKPSRNFSQNTQNYYTNFLSIQNKSRYLCL